MKKLVVACLALVTLIASPVFAQQAQKEAEIKRSVPYSKMLREFPTLTLQQYNQLVRQVAKEELRKEAGTLSRTPSYPSLDTSTPYTPPVYTPPTYTRPPRRSNGTDYSLPSLREPQSGTTLDAQSGNSYRWRRNWDGSTEVDGMNLNTGSMWRTNIKPDGSMRGTDSQFNPWTYDANTKTYMNLGTGKICVGEGYARVCS